MYATKQAFVEENCLSCILHPAYMLLCPTPTAVLHVYITIASFNDHDGHHHDLPRIRHLELRDPLDYSEDSHRDHFSGLSLPDFASPITPSPPSLVVGPQLMLICSPFFDYLPGFPCPFTRPLVRPFTVSLTAPSPFTPQPVSTCIYCVYTFSDVLIFPRRRTRTIRLVLPRHRLVWFRHMPYG